jgi:hypothetical protein
MLRLSPKTSRLGLFYTTRGGGGGVLAYGTYGDPNSGLFSAEEFIDESIVNRPVSLLGNMILITVGFAKVLFNELFRTCARVHTTE